MDLNPSIIARDLEGFRHMEFTDAIACQQTAYDNWNKTYTLKPLNQQIDWKLTDKDVVHTHICWKDEFLQDLKTKLNNQKQNLHDIDIYQWNEHTYATNPAFRVKNVFEKNAHPEFMTNAFLKLYEIISRCDLLPEVVNEEFLSVHLCEGPGAFIVALNHYMSLEKPHLKEKWQWIGHSLNPFYEGGSDTECITDDRFVYQTMKNWVFGENSTGDIINIKFINELSLRYGRRASLVTADGSIDCQHEPGEQELITHRLHLAEVISALLILKQDGCLIMKMFTFFECETINLLFLVCCAFAEVQLIKPITSKWANSEVYIIGRGFDSNYVDDILPHLITQIENSKRELSTFTKARLTDDFIENVKNCAKLFTNFQINAIDYNLKLFKNKDKIDKELNSYLKTCVLRIFKNSVTIGKIKSQSKLVPEQMVPCSVINIMKGVVPWSIWLRKCTLNRKIKILSEQIDYMLNNLNYSLNTFGILPRVESLTRVIYSELPNLRLIRGKPFEFVNISRFCPKLSLSALLCLLHIFDSVNVKFKDLKTSKDEERINKTASKVSNIYPATLTISDDVFSPNGACSSLDAAIVLLETNKLSAGGNMCTINTQLFTRFQVGLFIFIVSFFEKIYIHLPTLHYCPYIFFSNFDQSNFHKSINELKTAGWSPGGSKVGLLEIFPLKFIIDQELYKTVCFYNYSYCIFDSIVSQNILQDIN